MHEMSVALDVCRLAQERLGADTPRLVAIGAAISFAFGAAVLVAEAVS